MNETTLTPHRKITHFVSGSRQLQVVGEKVVLRHQTKLRDQLEREELLTRRRVMIYLLSTFVLTLDQGGDGEFEMDVGDRYEQEMETREKTKSSLLHSNQIADSILSSSYDVLESLQRQRDLLQGIRHRLTDVGSAIGLSDQVMRTIERRMTQDKWLVFGGMMGTLLLIAVLSYFL